MAEPGIRCEKVIPTLAVGDVDAAIRYYVDRLGFEESWRWGEPPVHASVLLDDIEVHLAGNAPDPGGSWLYFVVSDVDTLYAAFIDAGVDIVHEPQDQPWDMRELPVRDLVGNELTFAAPCMTREPSLPIEREEVNVRLEKRILAVLSDLAEHKGTNLTEVLEETLLHTFEPYGDGVASPHTAWDLSKIQELKEKHGLDYGVHASYRFVEQPGEDS